MTEIQKSTLDFIKEYIRKYGFPPTMRDIGDNFGITVKAARDRLESLERHNAIFRTKNISRGIMVNENFTS